MLFPTLQEVARYRSMTTQFGGYNHQISCAENQFFDMKNMTSKYFPVLSPRSKRGIIKTFKNPQGILDKEDMWWVDDKCLYKNGERIYLDDVEMTDESPKTLAKMGAYIIIMPDRIWINTAKGEDHPEHGYMEHTFEVKSGNPSVTFALANEYGSAIEYHDAEYYEKNAPKDGDYQMSVTAQGKPSLKVYSAATSIWMSVASPYIQIRCVGIGLGFNKDDGIKITCNTNKGLENILLNKEDSNWTTNTYIVEKTDDSITIPGIFSEEVKDTKDMSITVERKVPDLAYITECNNRLWGCSKDGHEVYCSKLGDVKNWNCFRGIATDSWAATIGSDGKFTGAVTYLGYPIFFKEDGLIKISVSSTGAHQTKETRCRGVQDGSSRSLVIMNENLYYKSTTGVCVYNGSLPSGISNEFGDVNYYDAAAGSVGDKYYISMRNNKNEYSMFVYDSKNGIWCKEDETSALMFLKYKDDLYYIDNADKTMKSIGGTILYDVPEMDVEEFVEWYAESGVVGYSSPDNKYVGRITLRITLDFGTNVDFYLEYDSSGVWEHKFNMSGTGTRTFSIPIIPRRCDHFKYKIKGKGGCKIHSVTKVIEGGSDD